MGSASSGFFKAGDDARLPAAAGNIGGGPLVDSVRKCGHLARRGANELAEPAPAADRGDPDRRYDLIQCLGEIGRHLLPDPLGCTAAAH